jgi:hypothetical protein
VQPAVGVPAHDLAVEPAQPADHLAWLRPAGGEITKADDVVDVLARDRGKDGVEGDAVAVDVANEGEAAHEYLANGCAPETVSRSRGGGHKVAGRDVAVTDSAIGDEHGRVGRSQRQELETAIDDDALGVDHVGLAVATGAVADDHR